MEAGRGLLPAGVAVATHLGSGYGDLHAPIALDLALKLLKQAALELTDFTAAQASDVDVVAGSVAFVVVLVAADVQQVQLVDQAVALEQVQGAIHSDAVHARVNLLRPAEDGTCVEMALGAVHDLQKDAALAGQADAAAFQRGLKLAGPGIGVDAFAGGDAVFGGGHALRSEGFFAWNRDKAPAPCRAC